MTDLSALYTSKRTFICIYPQITFEILLSNNKYISELLIQIPYPLSQIIYLETAILR